MNDIRDFLRNEIESLVFQKVSDDESLIKSKLLDSITVVDLMVAIEEQTGVHIPAGDVNADNFDTINLTVAYLEKK